jgi:hypothetical protein
MQFAVLIVDSNSRNAVIFSSARAQRKAFRRRDVRQQSRSFAAWNQSLRHSPNSNRLSLRLCSCRGSNGFGIRCPTTEAANRCRLVARMGRKSVVVTSGEFSGRPSGSRQRPADSERFWRLRAWMMLGKGNQQGA